MFTYDRQITISTAGNRRSTKWIAQTLYWSELVEKLRVPARGTETLAEYLRLPKARQDDLKDVGGFVAGTLAGERRKAGAVTGRDVITLDLDNIPSGGTMNVLARINGLGCGYAVYSTRKHSEAGPRIRVLVPLSRTASADEYEAVSRKLASMIGMELCDPSTFEPSRLMYWPSCCSDSQYVFTFADKPLLDVDGMLALYADWRDVSQWPQVPGAQPVFSKLAEKQGEPTEKPGVVGAFCRLYDIYAVMEKFIPGAYIPCDNYPDRFTYAGGSTTGGAVVYDNGKFLYSHHATDPAGGRLCNSFDLVRLHRFGNLDDEAKPDTPINRLPSYIAMQEFALQDPDVAAALTQARYDKALQDFQDAAPDAITPDNIEWIKKLAINPNTGKPAQSVDNVLTILENDPNLKGKFVFDEFSNRNYVTGPLPWNNYPYTRIMTDTDDAGIRYYIEKAYGITGKERIYDATLLCLNKNKINSVQNYIKSLKWDGEKRLDTLFVDYLGAEDTPYTRAVTRKSLVAAIARAMTPGVKYDTMVILTGPQGIGKSTLLRLLGKQWFNNSLSTFEGKEAQEVIQGSWIIELDELNGMSRSEESAVKSFLSRCEDIFREPYGRRTGIYPRRCVFFGTTNDDEFLRDQTGGRRFWPIKVGINPPTKSVFECLGEEVDQIWAEAFTYWQLGETLILTGETAETARVLQEAFTEKSTKEGVIRDFLQRPIPEDWDERTLAQRRLFWSGEFESGDVKLVERAKVCAAEIWCECFNGDLKNMKRIDAVEINGILNRIEGWEKAPNGIRFGKPYGLQRGFIKRF